MFNSENNKIIVLGLYVPILLFACSTNKKQSSHEDCPGYYELKRRIYTFVDTMPEYPGERSELLLFFAKNFTYPNVDYFQGSINLEFVIDIDGKVINEKIVNKETKDLTEVDKEALRVLKRMPKWIPGKCNDKIVPVRILFPLKF